MNSVLLKSREKCGNSNSGEKSAETRSIANCRFLVILLQKLIRFFCSAGARVVGAPKGFLVEFITELRLCALVHTEALIHGSDEQNSFNTVHRADLSLDISPSHIHPILEQMNWSGPA